MGLICEGTMDHTGTKVLLSAASDRYPTLKVPEL